MIKNLINRFTCTEKQIPIIINKLNKQNIYPIFDYINENKNNHYNNFNKIKSVIQQYPNNHFAIKFSSLNIENDYNLSKQYSNELCEIAINNNSKILLDAENYIIQDKINDLSNELVSKYNSDQVNIYKTYQCYRTDSKQILLDDIEKSKQDNYIIGAKLVRGAYYNEDFKHNILYNTINETHSNYNKSVLEFMKNCNDYDKLMIASHNEDTIKLCESLKHTLYCEQNIEYAQLLGMSDSVSNSLALNSSNKVFKYVPFGKLRESLPYLLRRLEENKDMIKYI
mgnify:CR=1 FL=1